MPNSRSNQNTDINKINRLGSEMPLKRAASGRLHPARC
jgi:hypothetical protein